MLLVDGVFVLVFGIIAFYGMADLAHGLARCHMSPDKRSEEDRILKENNKRLRKLINIYEAILFALLFLGIAYFFIIKRLL
jgi:hypothetical protein